MSDNVNPKDEGLKVEVTGGKLVISIGVEALAYAVMNNDEWPEGLTICEEEDFAKDVALELEREEEDGTTPVHRLLDVAAREAMEKGSLHVEEEDEDE